MMSGQRTENEVDGRARGPEHTPELAEVLRNAVRGQRLAEIRRGRGLTRHHLAEKMGVSQQHVYEIERGTIPDRGARPHDEPALGGRLRHGIHFDDGDIAIVE